MDIDKLGPLEPDAKAALIVARERHRMENRHRAEAGLAPLKNEPDVEKILGGFMTEAKARKLKMLLRELSLRSMQALKLYEPQPQQLAFHKSKAREKLAIGGNRAMKTTAAVNEVAMAVMGCHPWIKYPKENGRAYIVGRDEKHISEVMYRRLFRSDTNFKMIKEYYPQSHHIGMWRAYRPWTDSKRLSQTKPMLPLIPQRMVKKIAWKKQGRGIPDIITLWNGWELSFFTANGSPPRGSDIDLVWFDEEIKEGEWYSEMAARLLDRKGRFIWSATPQKATEILWQLHERAAQEATQPNPTIQEFGFRLDDNPFVDEEEKELLKKKFASDPDNYAVRIEGKFLISSRRMYPQFSAQTHVFPFFQIPQHWTRYAVVDPGNTVCAAGFFAVPPMGQLDGEGDYVYMYDELYIRDSNVTKFGAAFEQKTKGQQFEAFIIDFHGSVRSESVGKSIGQQYAEELVRREIVCNRTGSSFSYAGGDDAIVAGCEQFRAWLLNREDGLPPKFRVLSDVAPNFLNEIGLYRKKVKRAGGLDIVTDSPDQSKDNHLMDVARYIATYDPQYIKPRKTKQQKGSAAAYLAAKRKRQGKKPGYIMLGPGTGE